VVRACVASDTPVRVVDTETLNVQEIWERPQQPPSAAAGMHRISLGAAAGRGGGGGRGQAAAAPPADACTPVGGTPVAANAGGGRGRGGRGAGGGGGGGGGGGRGAPTLQAGAYTVRLTVDGQSYTQPVTVKPDPRGVPNGLTEGAGGGD
jgi:hypothetical protein